MNPTLSQEAAVEEPARGLAGLPRLWRSRRSLLRRSGSLRIGIVALLVLVFLAVFAGLYLPLHADKQLKIAGAAPAPLRVSAAPRSNSARDC